MKAAKICLVILFIAMVINFARQDAVFHISRTLPGMGKDPISLYDLAGVILLCLLIHAVGRIGRNTKRDNQPKH